MTKAQPEPKLTHIVIEAVSRQKRLFWTVFLVMVLLTVVAIVMIPKRYDANAQLIIENLRPQSSLSTQPVDKVVMSEDVTESQINSEVELLHSQSVLREALNMPPVSPDMSVSEMTADELLLQKLAGRLTIEPVRQSSIINVKLSDSTPKAAIERLNAIFNAYFEQRAKLTHASGAAGFFEAQTKDFGERLDEARKKLSDFEIAHELVDMNDQKKIVTTRIATIDDRINDAKAALANQGARTRELNRTLKTVPARSETTRRSLTNQYAMEHLNSALVDLENRRTELVHRYPPTDRAIIELDDKIRTTRSAIDEANLHPASENATDVNPMWQQVSSLLVAANVEITGTRAQQEELIAEKREAEKRLRELLQATGTYDDLNRNFSELQTNYNLYAQKRDEAKIGEALDTQKMFNVSLVQHPVATSTPTRPKPIPYLAAGIVLGLCLGVVVALYVDRSSDRIYTPQDLDALTQGPTLATIPDTNAPLIGRQEVESGPGGILEIRKLVTALRLAFVHPGAGVAAEVPGDGPKGHCIAFTSAVEGEGVTTVARNVVEEAARQARQSVALINMNLLNAMAGHGTTARVMMKRDPRSSVWFVDDNGGQFYASDGRPAGSGEIDHDTLDLVDLGDLHGERFWVGLDKVLERARAEFSLTLLDCPSLRSSSLALELDGDVDAYVVVVAAGVARNRQVEQVSALMHQAGAPLIGYVLNRRTYPVPGWVYDMFW